MVTTRRAVLERVQKQIRTPLNRPTGLRFRIADSSQGYWPAATENSGAFSWFGVAHNTTSGTGNNGRDEAAQKVPVYSDPRRAMAGRRLHLTSRRRTPRSWRTARSSPRGTANCFSKQAWDGGASARFSSKSNARKIASAMIARIPYDLASHIAQIYLPVANRT